MYKAILAAALAAPLLLAGCGNETITSAAQNGLRQDIKAVCEVTGFREVATEIKQEEGGKAAVLHFEGEVQWLTLEEALSRKGTARDAQEYLAKLQYASSRLGDVKAGRVTPVKGTIILAKSDLGWLYKELRSQ
jgi:hypothetical protein